MIVYLSGCYTNGNIEENIATARKIAIELWESGYTVLTPHLNTIHFEKDCRCKYGDYIKGDLELLARCDAIIMLQNWINSKGAGIEKEYAKVLGIPIYYYPGLPPQKERMTDAQETHLARIISRFTQDVSEKYFRGQIEHKGDLFLKPNLPMLLEEVLDMTVYAFTLADQIKNTIALCRDDEPVKAGNILEFGNSNGNKFSD